MGDLVVVLNALLTHRYRRGGPAGVRSNNYGLLDRDAAWHANGPQES
jgi:hypothetical protein